MYFTYMTGRAQIFVRKDEQGTIFIPDDPSNTEYQRYLEWLAAGNVPQPWEG